jgi:glucose-6-phosphate dehydrogenase assembly protein OpcA
MLDYFIKRDDVCRALLLGLSSTMASAHETNSNGTTLTLAPKVEATATARIDHGVRITAAIRWRDETRLTQQVHHKPCDRDVSATTPACEIIILELP